MQTNVIYTEDSLQGIPKRLPNESIDLMATDPQYGWNFMGRDWDRAVPSVDIWQQCFRVLKPGAFAFIMSGPRLDCLIENGMRIREAGFMISFTPIFWAFASGFPKAQNIGKAVDKRLGIKRKIIGKEKVDIGIQSGSMHAGRLSEVVEVDKTVATSPQAQALDGSYGGFQPKPAVEVVIVAMKPLSEKTYVDQALANRHGISWLDEGRISKSTGGKAGHTGAYGGGYKEEYYKGMNPGLGDSGSFSRYFSLDSWFDKKLKELPAGVRRTFPFLIVPKASKSEKNKGCENLYWEKDNSSFGYHQVDRQRWEWLGKEEKRIYKESGKRISLRARGNIHPTVKPLKLGFYLATIGSREGDIILDPFGGSGWMAIVAKSLGRRYIIFETEKENVKIAKARIEVEKSLWDLAK